MQRKDDVVIKALHCNPRNPDYFLNSITDSQAGNRQKISVNKGLGGGGKERALCPEIVARLGS